MLRATCDGVLGRDADAVEADVDLEHDVETAPGRAEASASVRAPRAVHARRQPHAIGQGQQAAALVRADHREGDEEVVEPGGGEDLRLPTLATESPDGARGELQPRDLDDLVGLGVRPQAHARARARSAMAATLRSTTSRSTSTAGVSINRSSGRMSRAGEYRRRRAAMSR